MFNNSAAKVETAVKSAENGEDEKLMDAAREFESYFLQLMLKEMRKTVPSDGLIPKSTATEIFEGMLDEEIAKSASQGTGIGLAQVIYEQMSRVNNAPPIKQADEKSGE